MDVAVLQAYSLVRVGWKGGDEFLTFDHLVKASNFIKRLDCAKAEADNVVLAFANSVSVSGKVDFKKLLSFSEIQTLPTEIVIPTGEHYIHAPKPVWWPGKEGEVATVIKSDTLSSEGAKISVEMDGRIPLVKAYDKAQQNTRTAVVRLYPVGSLKNLREEAGKLFGNNSKLEMNKDFINSMRTLSLLLWKCRGVAKSYSGTRLKKTLISALSSEDVEKHESVSVESVVNAFLVLNLV